jgi:hypothetical protein
MGMRKKPFVGAVGFFLLAGCTNLAQPGRSGLATSSLPTAVRVSCDANGAELAASKVQPHDDGVHFMVSNQTGKIGSFAVEGQGARRVALDANDIVLPVPPGTFRIACKHKLAGDAATIRVVDTSAVWRSPHLDCRHAVNWAISDQPAETNAGLLGLAREHLHGLTDNDQVQVVGYPKGKARRPGVRVVRSGKVIGGLWFRAALGGLIFEGASFCPASGLS